MNNLPVNPIPNNNSFTTWLIKARQSLVRNSSTSAGSDIVVNNTFNGTNIGFRNNRRTYMQYIGEYNPDSSYTINNVVTVLDNTTYTSGSTSYQSLPGTWICIKNVPMKYTAGDFVSASANVLSFFDAVSQVAGEVYAPVYPYPSDTNKQYWELISLAPTEITLCEDGQLYYINAQPSGSI